MIKKLLQFGLVAAIIGAIWQSQAVADWWQLRDYNPPAEITSITERASFNDDAANLFYLNQPELNEKESFNQNCQSIEKSNILGCYVPSGLFNQGRIYLLSIKREELSGVEEVTAAHEVLHVAYQRLSNSERSKVNEMLEADFKEHASDDLRQKINLYDNDVSLRLNEMHSFLGTETKELSPELEDYYSQYFYDRSQVVALFHQYEEVFEEIEAKTARLEAEITALKTEITNLHSQIDAKRAELDATRSQMDAHRARGETEAYNALVPRHNRLLAEHNALVREHNEKVDLHNAKGRELNRLALRHSDLAESLDSRQSR